MFIEEERADRPSRLTLADAIARSQCGAQLASTIVEGEPAGDGALALDRRLTAVLARTGGRRGLDADGAAAQQRAEVERGEVAGFGQEIGGVHGGRSWGTAGSG